MLRWWSSGLCFGDLEVRSRLRIRHVYAAYARFVGYAILFSMAVGVVGAIALVMVGAMAGVAKLGAGGEILATLFLLAGYVVTALGFSTIYRATVLLSLWQLGMRIAATDRSFCTRKGQGHRTPKLRDWRGTRRRTECGQLLMPTGIEGPQR